ncbi:MAG TPA: small, acid-soluble spore protein, alpha/beta type [Ruminiclostridium sp.]|uniref:Small, acid-soluble spore protein, alpha/beta type n=1 Tax=Acetivibrio saccincola TaxID=1677857 RepID=A0A2K9EF45_9FIRM|nr:small, acid-soluble spore protein, alpha/beta type [Acetivibrio saccincola]HAA43428.1 small, acid-soluble spore protein, alpha/beta type [Ruminiclostridium sp.]AUG58764.1 Small, acid-soluble spore protein, alpha/beta type [Acetivibrio saccincola]NLW26899.1 small, acid-soluble spore protein, alpha/beta type [Acetivibrio saccincola]PQQ66140.1 small, acid-soluble spore protein, alpha/beta type [Acetivibrio saccincola]HOA97319.1 small, acid-soluble spore protein, alpha/beta type [Acetivibrio sa
MENIDEKLKYEVAAELGLFEKIKKEGWKSLTAKETGRIGGLITKRKKMLQAQKKQKAL